MDRDTYDNGAVSDYLSQKYVAIKINAESSKTVLYQGQSYTERELAAAFGVSGYPCIVFLKHDGEPITVYPGYADANKSKVVLRFIAEIIARLPSSRISPGRSSDSPNEDAQLFPCNSRLCSVE